MPRKQFNRSMVATLLGLLIAVPAAVLTLATPAFADEPKCCDVALNNVPKQFQAGGEAKAFTLRVVNRSGQSLRYLNVTFIMHANGLNANQVHLQRQRVLGGPRGIGARNHDGEITAYDQIDLGVLALPPGGGVSIQYKLAFGQKAPGTGLSLSVRVQPRKNNGQPASAGPYGSTILAYGVATKPTPTQAVSPTPTDSLTPSLDPTDGGSDVAGAPTDQSTVLGNNSGDSGGGSLMWLAYTLGALLLLGGVGVIGTMLYRRGPHAVETDWEDQGQPGYGAAGYGQPAHPGGGYAPTQVAGYAPTQVTDYGPPTQVADYGPTQVADYSAPTQVGGFGAPGQQGGYQTPTRANPSQAPTRVTPPAPGGGRHSAPTSRYPAAQDPYAEPDQTWVDPRAGR